MGSATSRPLQKLPKTLSNPNLKPNHNLNHNQQKSTPSSIPKSGMEPIHNPDDLPDPNLLSNLAQLGQVRVQNPAVDIPVPAEEAFRTTPSAFSLPRNTRNTPSSIQSLTRPRNTLSAQALSTLLDALKSDSDHSLTRAKQLVHQHNLDWDVYQRIANYVNTPTIGRQKQIHLSDDVDSNSFRLLKEAIWVDPPYTRTEPPP